MAILGTIFLPLWGIIGDTLKRSASARSSIAEDKKQTRGMCAPACLLSKMKFLYFGNSGSRGYNKFDSLYYRHCLRFTSALIYYKSFLLQICWQGRNVPITPAANSCSGFCHRWTVRERSELWEKNKMALRLALFHRDGWCKPSRNNYLHRSAIIFIK